MKILRRVQVEQAILSQCLAPSRAVNSSTAIRQVQYIHLRRTVELLTLLAHEGGGETYGTLVVSAGALWLQSHSGSSAAATARRFRDRQTDRQGYRRRVVTQGHSRLFEKTLQWHRKNKWHEN